MDEDVKTDDAVEVEVEETPVAPVGPEEEGDENEEEVAPDTLKVGGV